VRTARVLVASALHEGEAALVEDRPQPCQPRMQPQRLPRRITSDLQHLPRRHRDVRASAVVEGVLVGHDRVQRVVAAIQVDDDQAARSGALRARDIRQERRRREADGECRDTVADERPAGNLHLTLRLRSAVSSLRSRRRATEDRRLRTGD
jgi:hypothetical protein